MTMSPSFFELADDLLLSLRTPLSKLSSESESENEDLSSHGILHPMYVFSVT